MVDDVATSNFLQYQQESVHRRETHSFVHQSQPTNIRHDDQEFKVPFDLSIVNNGLTNESVKDKTAQLSNQFNSVGTHKTEQAKEQTDTGSLVH